MPGQVGNHDLPLGSQLEYHCHQFPFAAAWRQDRAAIGWHRGNARQIVQIHAEPCRRTRASKCLADFIIASAQCHGICFAGYVGGEHHPAVIVITTQIGEVDANRVSRFA